MLAMAAVSQIAISGWVSLESDMKMAVADVILSNLPTSFILEMTASICGKIGKGSEVKYEFLKMNGGNFMLKDKGLKEKIKKKRKITNGEEWPNMERAIFQPKSDPNIDIPGLSIDKIPGLLSEIYEKTKKDENDDKEVKSPKIEAEDLINTFKNKEKSEDDSIDGLKPDLKIVSSENSPVSSTLNLSFPFVTVKGELNSKPVETFKLEKDAPVPEYFIQKSQSALRRMRVLKCVKPSCSDQFMTQSCEDLWKHLTEKHTGEYLCPNCSRLLKERAGLENHFQSCYRKFTCEICGTEFTRKDNLLRHKKSRHPEEHMFLGGGKYDSLKRDF